MGYFGNLAKRLGIAKNDVQKWVDGLALVPVVKKQRLAKDRTHAKQKPKNWRVKRKAARKQSRLSRRRNRS